MNNHKFKLKKKKKKRKKKPLSHKCQKDKRCLKETKFFNAFQRIDKNFQDLTVVMEKKLEIISMLVTYRWKIEFILLFPKNYIKGDQKGRLTSK